MRGVKVAKPVNKLFYEAVDYQNYRFIKNYTGCEEDVANELKKMTKKNVVKMKDKTFKGRYPCR